jgi:hypothetical protein
MKPSAHMLDEAESSAGEKGSAHLLDVADSGVGIKGSAQAAASTSLHPWLEATVETTEGSCKESPVAQVVAVEGGDRESDRKNREHLCAEALSQV